MIIEKYIFDENINNSSDILCLYNDGFLNNLLIKKSYDIMICSILNKNKKLININNQIILNLDKYISFLKRSLNIDQLLIRYIVTLTINNLYNKILSSPKYYFDNVEYYTKYFKKMFIYNYNRNHLILKKFNIKKHNFDELVKIINKNQKKAIIYLEKIDKHNLNFALNVIEYLETSIWQTHHKLFYNSKLL